MTPGSTSDEETVPPKIFVSYSWTSDDHAQWVLDLATRLQRDGVETILDRWCLKPGQDKYKFMEQMVADPKVQKVLMICDRRYAARADGREGGVGEETQIISSEVYGTVAQTKFLPVIAERDENGQPYKPHYLKARLHIDLSDPLKFEQGYEDLLRDIVGQPLHTPPPLGNLPSFLRNSGDKPLPTANKLSMFRGALIANKPTAAGLAEDYLNHLLQEMGRFSLQNYRGDGQSQEQALRKSLDDFLPYRNEYIDFLLLVTPYGDDPRLFATLPRFFMGALPLILSGIGSYRVHHQDFEPYQLLVPELFLYTIAGLLKREHYAAVNELLSRRYQDDGATSGGRTRSYGFDMYEASLPTLENGPKSSMFYRPGPTAQMLKQRASHTGITALNLVDADYVLYVRTLLNPDAPGPHGTEWRPQLHLFIDLDHNAPMPFFVSAQAKTVFERAKVVLNVRDKQDLTQKMEAAVGHAQANRIVASPLSREQTLMGISYLDTA